jgi:hypothetical protein
MSIAGIRYDTNLSPSVSVRRLVESLPFGPRFS